MTLVPDGCYGFGSWRGLHRDSPDVQDRLAGRVERLSDGAVSRGPPIGNLTCLDLFLVLIWTVGRRLLTRRIAISAGTYVRAQDRVDASLVSLSPSAEPLEYIGIEANGDGLLRPRHNEFGFVQKFSSVG